MYLKSCRQGTLIWIQLFLIDLLNFELPLVNHTSANVWHIHHSWVLRVEITKKKKNMEEPVSSQNNMHGYMVLAVLCNHWLIMVDNF